MPDHGEREQLAQLRGGWLGLISVLNDIPEGQRRPVCLLEGSLRDGRCVHKPSSADVWAIHML